MATVLERALAQFDTRATHSVEVPEWGEAGKPLTVYFRAPNAATLSKVTRDSEGDAVKQMAMLVAQCALDEKGGRLFTNMNWRDLFDGTDPAVVGRIAGAIMAEARFGNESVKDAEKN